MEPRFCSAEMVAGQGLEAIVDALQHPALRITSRMSAMLPNLGSAELTLEACAVYPNVF
jgi:hypothetical protein